MRFYIADTHLDHPDILVWQKDSRGHYKDIDEMNADIVKVWNSIVGKKDEVDIVGELGAGSVIAIEVKAASAPGKQDARHLTWLRDKLGDTFVSGVLLHTGPRSFILGDRITAAPISTLWA